MMYQISDGMLRYLRKKLLLWGRNNFSDFPWRIESNQFHALIAEVLLQRTRAEQVVGVYLEFKNRFPDPDTLAKANISDVEQIIAPLGLKWRAKFISALGNSIQERGGLLPSELKDLQQLPGIGPYAAAAYLSLHSDRRVPIIDSNIVRFYGRFFGFQTGPETRRGKGISQLAEQITPKRLFRSFNYALIDFTRKVCKPKPNHNICPIAKKCSFVSPVGLFLNQEFKETGQ